MNSNWLDQCYGKGNVIRTCTLHSALHVHVRHVHVMTVSRLYLFHQGVQIAKDRNRFGTTEAHLLERVKVPRHIAAADTT